MSFELPPPDPTNPDVLVGIQKYLEEQGIVRAPEDDTHQLTLPPIWLEPRHGVPPPGPVEGLKPSEVSPLPSENGPGVVVGLERMTGVPSPPYEGFIRIAHVQFVVRSFYSPASIEFEQNVRVVLNDKRGWTMFNVPVNESLVFRDIQPISKDNTSYTYAFEYSFSLWGPFTPVGP